MCSERHSWEGLGLRGGVILEGQGGGTGTALPGWMNRSKNKPLLLVGMLLFAPVALAHGGPEGGMLFLSVGGLFSETARPEGATPALGAEASLHGFVDNKVGLGLFGQWQRVKSEEPHTRFCAGPQVTYKFVGLELGAAYEKADGLHATTASLHLAPFISNGALTVSLRVDVPLWHEASETPGHGYDVGGVLAVKLPLLLNALRR